MPGSRSNELLGYVRDARLLILNADDFGMHEAINEGALRALTQGVARSTTVMVPCPGAAQALQLLKQNPTIAFGVHLTVIRDLPQYRYGPLTPTAQTPSLVDEAGHFYTTERMAEFLARARTAELEVEFRAQIEDVLTAGLQPTHLDWHCLHSGGRADIFDLTMGLAHEYGLAVRVAQPPLSARVQSKGLPTADYDLLDSFRLPTHGKTAHYAQLLRDLPAGLSEWAVHPGLGNVQSQRIDPDGWPVRQADLDFLLSAEARTLIQQEGIIVLDYRPLQAVWAANANAS